MLNQFVSTRYSNKYQHKKEIIIVRQPMTRERTREKSNKNVECIHKKEHHTEPVKGSAYSKQCKVKAKALTSPSDQRVKS